MPDITDDEMKEYRSLQSKSVGMELDVVKANFRADNPHVPAALVNSYQGDPTGFSDGFGKALLEQFPKPQVATPASQQPAPPAAPATPPPAQAQTPPPPALQQIPAASSPPIMAAQFPVPMSPEAQRQAYLQAQANGGVPPIQPSVPAPMPAPGSTELLPQVDATVQQSQVIREKMRLGTATTAEAQWLAQYGEKGFVAAARGHARKVAAIVGARS